MIDLILSFFGYVKIRKPIVQLSMELEDAWAGIARVNEKAEIYLEAQRYITKFLRAGRLISWREDG